MRLANLAAHTACSSWLGGLGDHQQHWSAMMLLTTALDLPLSDDGVHRDCLPFLEVTTYRQSDVGLVG